MRSDGTVLSGRVVAALFVAFAILQHVLFARSNGAVLSDGGLLDTDSYLRVIRILDLWRGGGWYDTVTQKLGAPEGLSLHWSRPVDVLILLPALLAGLFGADVPRAVYWIGASFSPFCHILACLAAVWAARPLWPGISHRFAAVVLLTGGAAFGYGTFGRADHHALLLLMSVLGLGAALRAAAPPSDGWDARRWAMAAGAFMGFGVWVSPEILIIASVLAAVFGLYWLLASNESQATASGHRDSATWGWLGCRYALGMALVLLIAVPIEQPPARWLVAEYDKISILHLLLALVWAAVFAGGVMASRAGFGRPARAAIGAVLAVAGLGLLLALFPQLLEGPLGTVDQRSKQDWLDDIREMQPLWPGDVANLQNLLNSAGQGIVALILLPYCLMHWWRGRVAAGWMTTIVFAALLVAALMHARLAVELSAPIAVICAGAFALVERWLRGRPRLLRTPILALTGIVLTVGPLVAGAALGVAPEVAGCRTKDLAEWLEASPPVAGPAPVVMTDDISLSPELVYRTHYRGVAGPYHRGAAAIADTVDVFTANVDTAARAILDRRQVEILVVCTDTGVRRLMDAGPDALYARLRAGGVPDWLVPLAPPANVAKSFKVYRVLRNGSAG